MKWTLLQIKWRQNSWIRKKSWYIDQELSTENQKKILIETTAKRHIRHILRGSNIHVMGVKEKSTKINGEETTTAENFWEKKTKTSD